MTASQFSPIDMMRSSQNDYSLTTARVAAMGGAFTALGGDMASMGINPAGIGMYRTSAWGFSPTVTMTDSKGPYATANGNNTSRFGFNNIGTVLQLSQSSSGMVSFNIGLTYNKIEDYNFSGSVSLPGGNSSLLDIFQLQLNGLYNYMDFGEWQGLSHTALTNDPFNNPDIYIDEWGAVLGYQSELFPFLGDDTYGISGIPESGGITPSLSYTSRGSSGEYNIAGGFNINNIVYFGFDFGFRDMHQELSLYYNELYGNDYAGTAQQYLYQMRYNQYCSMQGSAFNFKIGAIIRPIPALQIGVAYHSPSYTTIRKEYYSSMGTSRYATPDDTHLTSFVTGYDYSFRTPSRLLAGAAVTVGNRLAISFDYERVWYNKMRYTSETYEIQESFSNAISNDYQAVNNFRFGIEFKPLDRLALRAGYAYYGSPVKEKGDDGSELIFNSIFTTSLHRISAGIGIWLGPTVTLDLAYVYSRYKIAPYELYYYNGPARMPDGILPSVTYAPEDYISGGRLDRHTVTMSFNFLF